ncbi:hypothetical protein HD592_001463 [Schaalia hyovaginalis]|uniref:Uncharacterized protein n=1 Tax=Schaalia hyovaginalis TaxID=29316 RepID=A0A923IXX7_9ACTO|nr:hypothetical protein [Schaalia hyovaginalis]
MRPVPAGPQAAEALGHRLVGAADEGVTRRT